MSYQESLVPEPALVNTDLQSDPCLEKNGEKIQSKAKMFIHHVFFWLKNSSSKSERDQLLEGLRSLIEIETIRSAHIGVPADTDRPVIDKSYTFSLLLSFENKEKQDIYQDHPLHQKFVQDCSPLWERVVVYDSVDAGS